MNGNSMLSLPEQEGLIEWFDQETSQGYVWHDLIKAVAEIKNIDISNAYIEPEGDVFIAYAPNHELLTTIANIINDLLCQKTLMLQAAKRAGL